MSKKQLDEKPSGEIIHSLSVNRMARILEKSGFIAQLLRTDDGKPAIRFMKLGIDGMALFFGPVDDHFKIVVLNALLTGVMPVERVNALNSRGVLPKIYANDKNTIIELCIPLEAGLTDEAVAYYVQAFEVMLTSL
jgi:hypothetical protein